MPSKTELASNRLHLELASEFDHLERAVEQAQAFMERTTGDDDLAYRVVLLTSEAVANAMEHGNSYDPHKRVFLEITTMPERIDVIVEDEGVGFNPADVDNPLEKNHLLDTGGRGIFLMEHMADEVRWEKDGCRLCLTFYRAS